MPLTKALGRFVADLSPNRLPEEAVTVAALGFTDCVGTMIAGRNEACTQILKGVLAPTGGPASLYFSGEKSPAPEAGWINGTAAHALDYDDVGVHGHPSTVLLPAILAEAEVLDAGGLDMITAYVAGYETWAELCRRDMPTYHAKGWHPTGIFGAIAAAAACAKLRRLDAAKTAMALALGASQSAGIMANFGTMTKPFHAGRAAHAGIIAARLAEAGFTSSLDALEHPQGFLSAVSPEGNPDRESEPRLGEDWAILHHGVSIKKYPACYGTHRAIDSILGLLAEHPVKPDEVGKVSVHFGRLSSKILRNHQPDTGLSAKFSMEFAMASSLIAGRVTLKELTDSFVRRADVQGMMHRVELDITDEVDPENRRTPPWEQVRIALRSGETIEGPKVARATGHAERPLSESQLYEKFVDCLAFGGSVIPAEALYARLKTIRSMSARALTAVH
jgi:2-methylcitrate dehydratase PrpD